MEDRFYRRCNVGQISIKGICASKALTQIGSSRDSKEPRHLVCVSSTSTVRLVVAVVVCPSDRELLQSIIRNGPLELSNAS